MDKRNAISLWSGSGLRPLVELRREMDRLFDEFWSVPTMDRQLRDEFQFMPAFKVEEEQGHYVIMVETPGVSRDELSVEVIDNQIVVSGERRQENKKDESGSEQRFERFQRSFVLPSGIDSGRIEAQYQDGMLKLTVPKAESARPRRIEIASESGKRAQLTQASAQSKTDEKKKAA